MVNINKVKVYDSLKRIPNLRCACCGEKLIDYGKLRDTWALVERPLSKVMSKDFKWLENQNPELYNLLDTLAKENPNKSIDKIMKDTQNYAKVRDLIDIEVAKTGISEGYEFKRAAQSRTFEILMAGRASLKSASLVMKKFAKFKHFLTDKKLKVFEQLQIYAEKYPRKTLTEIVNIDDIFKFHSAKDLLQRAESREVLDYHFNNIEKMIKKAKPESLERFKDLKIEVLNLFDTIRDKNIRVFKTKEIYRNALKECGCEKLERKIFKEIDSLPETFVSHDTFFVHAKNAHYNDSAIISSIFNPKVASVEHIIPRSKNGTDNVSNYIAMCRNCNAKRSSIPYDEFLLYHPEMKKNTERQVKVVGNKILKGELTPDYKFYPMQVSLLLKKYTNGKISPNLTNYCNKMLEKSENAIAKNSEKLSEIKIQKAEYTKDKHKLKEQLSDIGTKLDNLDLAKDEIIKNNMYESEVKSVIKQYLDKQV